jgi:3-oxoacyl-[acyl-carrier-protein] synthase-3
MTRTMKSDCSDRKINSFACAPGDVECCAKSIDGFNELWSSWAPGADFAHMGCESFRKMSGSIVDYIITSIDRTLQQSGTAPSDVNHIIFSMADATLKLVGTEFVADVLGPLGLSNCVPILISYQQCCSSLTALHYGWQLFDVEDIEHVVVVGFDFRPDDRDRVRPFAVFGDAVTSCMISRQPAHGMRLGGSALSLDFAGLTGDDSFGSRQTIARAALGRAFTEADLEPSMVTRVFPSNLFRPLTLFNAAAAGIDRTKLHFDTTFRRFGHCGNPDWMLNLIDYEEAVGIERGDVFLALGTAPGFFACNLLVADDG